MLSSKASSYSRADRCPAWLSTALRRSRCWRMARASVSLGSPSPSSRVAPALMSLAWRPAWSSRSMASSSQVSREGRRARRHGCRIGRGVVDGLRHVNRGDEQSRRRRAANPPHRLRRRGLRRRRGDWRRWPLDDARRRHRRFARGRIARWGGAADRGWRSRRLFGFGLGRSLDWNGGAHRHRANARRVEQLAERARVGVGLERRRQQRLRFVPFAGIEQASGFLERRQRGGVQFDLDGADGVARGFQERRQIVAHLGRGLIPVVRAASTSPCRRCVRPRGRRG